MSVNFEKYAAKGNEMINKLADDLDISRDKAARILRATLHALRNRISTDESFHILSQLPMALKALYVDGWNPNKSFVRIKHLKDFIAEIKNEDGITSLYDYENYESSKNSLQAVFRTLNYYISQGEMGDIINSLPLEIRVFLNDAVEENRKVL